MASIRPAAVAGSFYPQSAPALRASIARLLPAAADRALTSPKVLIVPHAGLVYSGPIAGTAYHTLATAGQQVRRVVLLGPAHRVWLQGLAVPSATAFATPLGAVPVDRAAVAAALALPGVVTNDEAHAAEHSLEVQLPFLQVVLGEFSLVPLVVGAAEPEAVAQVIDALWGGAETLVVVSSDLSHYHDYDTANVRDRETVAAIEGLVPAALGRDSACGRRPLQGLLLVAQQRGVRLQCLDRRNSGDTAGPRERVVGYAAFTGC
jgi:AmmeMemoRadiSam system protein B